MAGCRKCGGGGNRSTSPSIQETSNSDVVLIEYIGQQTQKQRLTSKVNPREKYVFSGDSRKFRAYRGDVDFLISMKNQFRIAEQIQISASSAVLAEMPVLQSHTKPKAVELPLDVLTVDPITLGLLRRKFNSVSELVNAGRAEWMTIKGIGAVRADEIQEAIDAL